MREIKFRGLSDNFEPREWFYGCLVNQDDKHFIIHEDIENMVIVDPETVGQYTGCKDKNDKEIYEGDILQVDDPEDKSTCKVIFYEGSFCQDHGIDEDGFSIVIPLDKKTLGIWGVIGNIHENPELLEVE